MTPLFPRRRPFRACTAAIALAVAGTWFSSPAAHAAPPQPAADARAAGTPAAVDGHAADREALLTGVKAIARPGVPGPLALSGAAAWALVPGKLDGEALAPVVAVSRLGSGRVVAFGHTGYLGRETLASADTARLMENAIGWVVGPRGKDVVPARVRVGVRGDANLVQWINDRGHAARALTGAWEKSLTGEGVCDVIVLDQGNLSETQRAAVLAHAQEGRGLIVAGLGWGWQQVHGGRPLNEHPLNVLLAPAGLAFADGTLEATDPRGGSGLDAWQLDPRRMAMLGAMNALDRLEQRANAPRGKPDAETKLDDQASATVSLAARFDYDSASPLRTRLETLLAKHGQRVNPSPGTPLRRADGLARALLSYELRRAEAAAPEQVTAHRSAGSFPGAVADTAPRVATTVAIMPADKGWRSLGLYAPAGQVVTVTLPAGAPGGLRVQIGCHTDQLWHLERWNRAPDIVVSRELRPGANRIASAFGGLVYITGSAKGDAAIEARVAGAVEAPIFVLGKDDKATWAKQAARPGPWAELVTSKVILTVPAAVARKLDDPAELLTWWDRVLDAHADLATIPRDRERPERIVADEQISAGYMHSGYPIMTHLDAAPHMTNLADLKVGKNAWGLFHELGHNHQVSDWTFEGTGEVTVNLFTLHALETVCGLPPGAGHEGLAKPEPMLAHIAAGAPFEAWKRDPFLALRMYFQMRQAFGWETYKKVFAEYRALPREQRPKGDAQERDQWMVRFSLTAGCDLGPFFEKWGVPVSAEARKKTAHLPVWMPEGL